MAPGWKDDLKRVLKRLFLSLVIGATLGNVLTLLLAPSMLTWFATPATGSALCNCAETAEQTARSLVRAQLFGTGSGSVVGMVLGELAAALWRSRTRSPPDGTAPVQPPPA